jgi:ceramide glucosyltransferase
MDLNAIPVVLSSAWAILSASSVVATARSKAAAPDASRPLPVSVLKPLAGADAGLRDNLKTFFEQDHPDFELVFGVEDETDPAVNVVKDLMRTYPAVRAKLIAKRGDPGLNPKVRNLSNLLPEATHDLFLISDSNVRAPSGYLREAALTFARAPDIGLVTHLFSGEPGDGAASWAESVQLTGFCAGGAALATRMGDASVIGKSMMMSRRAFEALGGLSKVANVLAEDYVIGKMFEQAGKRVVLGSTILTNVLGDLSVTDVYKRHLRWAMMRVRLRPTAYAFEPFTSPLFVLPFAWNAMQVYAAIWFAFALFIRDGIPWLTLRGEKGLKRAMTASVLRETIMLAVWFVAPWKRHIAWRGKRVRLVKGTRLVPVPTRSA